MEDDEITRPDWPVFINPANPVVVAALMTLSRRAEELVSVSVAMAKVVASQKSSWGTRVQQEFDSEARVLLRRLHVALDGVPTARD